jgi:hypothetical protein
MDEKERGRGCLRGINGRTAGEERRGESGEVQRKRERGVVPPGGTAADGGRPRNDRDRAREEVAGEAVRGERGFGSSVAVPAGWSRMRLVTSRGLTLSAVGMPAVRMATPTQLGGRVRWAVCRGRARGRMSPPDAAAAVVVCDRGEQPGRQMRGQAQGHEAATHCASVEHVARGD